MSTRSRRRKAAAEAQKPARTEARPWPTPTWREIGEDEVERFDEGRYSAWLLRATGVTVVMMRLEPSWPAEIHGAYMRRRDASLIGVCACGGVVRRSGGSGRVLHEHDCPASDELFLELLEGWWSSAGRA